MITICHLDRMLCTLSRDGEWFDCPVDIRRMSQCGHSFDECNRVHATRKLAMCRVCACDQSSIHDDVSIQSAVFPNRVKATSIVRYASPWFGKRCRFIINDEPC
jgi:hypothetical protein